MLRLDRKFEFNGQAVAWGSIGDGPPVVMIHGFPWSSQAWRRIAPWLAKDHTVYYFDMLGCGLSEKSDGQQVSENVQSDLLEALVSEWGIERPHVIGHDFGGLCALRGHFVNGIEYSRLSLIDPVAVLPSGSPFYAHVAHHETAFAGLPDYAHRALFRAYIQNAANYPLREEVALIYEEPWVGDVGQAAFYRQIAQADIRYISEVESRYRKPKFDLSLIWGERDTFIPIEHGERLRAALGAPPLVRISDAAHLVQEEAPDAIVGALLTELRAA